MKFWPLAFIVLFYISARAQNSITVYRQFKNEWQFTRPLKGKWAMELDGGQVYTSAPGVSNSPFFRSSQYYVVLWAHYYPSPRWKLSAFFGYYYNQDVPEISQDQLPEFRASYQAIYYFHKVKYTLTGRFRIEDRHIRTFSRDNVSVFRFRLQGKLVVPINGKFIHKGVVYGLASDEVYFKTTSSVTGPTFFDRNELIAGAGYSFTDDIQMELQYGNEYLPRPGADKMYHTYQTNIVFNNLSQNIKKWFENRKRRAAEGPHEINP